MAIRSLLTILVLAAAGLYARDLDAKRASTEGSPPLAELPRNMDGWESEDYPLSDEVTRVLAATATLNRRYFRMDGTEVWLFVAYFAEQQVNSQIHSPKNCLPGSGWVIVSTKEEPAPVRDHAQKTTHMVIRRQDAEFDMYYWFQTRGGTVTGEYSLKWDLVKNSLARRPTDAAFIRYSAGREDGEALHDLMGRLDQPLTAVLGEVGLP
jgi:EpsI family protein